MDAKSFNCRRFGHGFTLADLPDAWAGAHLLRAFDADDDTALSEAELRRVDWAAFSDAVAAFQADAGLTGDDLDGKLGPGTLALLGERFPRASTFALRIGDLELPLPSEPLAPPPDRLANESGSATWRAVVRLWNNYGGAVLEQAARATLDPAVAALESASYGLPQLMGFNFRVTAHADARAMLVAFQRSAREQIAGFFGFVAANHLADLARQGKFVAFARRYNGIGKEALYADKIRRYLTVARRLVAG